MLPRAGAELTVRAAWEPSGHDGVDLEIQMSALSVDQLKAVEVKLMSVLPEPPTARRRRWVEPRDVRAAGLSYDGRDGDARDLTTLPPAVEETLAPRVLPAPWADGRSYIEMVPLGDVARRITEGGTISRVGHTTRYGLFGHDLEKGVVIRARLRGLWTDSKTPGTRGARTPRSVPPGALAPGDRDPARLRPLNLVVGHGVRRWQTKSPPCGRLSVVRSLGDRLSPFGL